MLMNGAVSVLILALLFAALWGVHEAVRSEVSTEALATLNEAELSDQQLVAHYQTTGDGDPCTQDEQQEIWDKFEIGINHNGRSCSKQSDWGNEITYEHPTNKEQIALYLYPADDHNGAFGFCIGQDRKFDRVFCKRLLLQTRHYSVKFWRVANVEQATTRLQIVRDLGLKIQHLVLGGHGAPYGLWWGNDNDACYTGTPRTCSISLEVNDRESDAFLCKARGLMLNLDGTKEASTVFLDSCLNGKRTAATNMVQFVAHKINGAKVFGSQISFSSDQVSVHGNGEHFNAQITEGRKRVIAKLQHDGNDDFRHWDLYSNSLCDVKDDEATDITTIMAEGFDDLHACWQACARKESCQAFGFFEIGKIVTASKGPEADKQCYLSDRCHQVKPSKQGAVTFVKRDPPSESSPCPL